MMQSKYKTCEKHYKHPSSNDNVIRFTSSTLHPSVRHSHYCQLFPGHPPVPVFTLESKERYHQGFYIVPNALPVSKQYEFAALTLSECIEPPHCTNLHAHYPIPSCTNLWPENKTMLDQLHWAEMGLHFDWTQRQYTTNTSPMPLELSSFASWCVSKIDPSMSIEAQASIVNFYKHNSIMRGHIDDLEKTFDHPVVSISIGMSAIFLKGGYTKDIEPLAIELNSGDVVVMGGTSRLSVHGIARIHAPVRAIDDEEIQTDGVDPEVVAFLAQRRININLRQVFLTISSHD